MNTTSEQQEKITTKNEFTKELDQQETTTKISTKERILKDIRLMKSTGELILEQQEKLHQKEEFKKILYQQKTTG